MNDNCKIARRQNLSIRTHVQKQSLLDPGEYSSHNPRK